VKNLSQLKERYETLGVMVEPTMTCDRAGDVRGVYLQDVHVSGQLTGCGWPLTHANISVSGDLFLCCNDYYQREIFGNVMDGYLCDIMRGGVATKARLMMFGVSEGEDGVRCRNSPNQALAYPGRQFRPDSLFG